MGAANAATCTAMMPSQLQLAAQLPGYPTGDVGLIMSLSQTPCAKPGACCNANGGVCANWAGAHLSSLGCIHYGVLETEAAFNLPPTSGAVAFFGCVSACLQRLRAPPADPPPACACVRARKNLHVWRLA